MAELFPAGYETETAEVAQLTASAPAGLRPGPRFDRALGDFPRDGRNRMMDADPAESWEEWVRNCLETERHRHLAYGPNFGIETAEAFRAPSREGAETVLTREITEALLADPYRRTVYVEDVGYRWDAPDEVTVTVTVHGLGDRTAEVTARIPRGGDG